MKTRYSRILLVALLLLSATILSIRVAPTAFAGSCSTSTQYQRCGWRNLTQGWIEGHDGYAWPSIYDPNCPLYGSQGYDDFCWIIRSYTHTQSTGNSDKMYTQETGYDTCSTWGGNWIQRQTSEAYITTPTTWAIGSDAYGDYGNCSSGHEYEFKVYHWRWLGGVQSGYSNTYIGLVN